MPRWYFHLYQSGDVLLDPEGVDIADIAAVRVRALSVARDLIAADAATGVLYLDTRLCIADAQGDGVFEIAFADAVAIVPAAETDRRG